MKQTKNGRKSIFAYSILALLEDEFIFNIFKVWKDESNMDNINSENTKKSKSYIVKYDNKKIHSEPLNMREVL